MTETFRQRCVLDVVGMISIEPIPMDVHSSGMQTVERQQETNYLTDSTKAYPASLMYNIYKSMDVGSIQQACL